MSTMLEAATNALKMDSAFSAATYAVHEPHLPTLIEIIERLGYTNQPITLTKILEVCVAYGNILLVDEAALEHFGSDLLSHIGQLNSIITNRTDILGTETDEEVILAGLNVAAQEVFTRGELPFEKLLSLNPGALLPKVV